MWSAFQVTPEGVLTFKMYKYNLYHRMSSTVSFFIAIITITTFFLPSSFRMQEHEKSELITRRAKVFPLLHLPWTRITAFAAVQEFKFQLFNSFSTYYHWKRLFVFLGCHPPAGTLLCSMDVEIDHHGWLGD